MTAAVNPTISGRTLNWTTAGGQHAYVHALLPNTDTTLITSRLIDGQSFAATNEPFKNAYWLQTQDMTQPQNIRFLHVIQTVDTAGTQASPTLVQSSAGTTFD